MNAQPRVSLSQPEEGIGKGPYSAALGRSFFISSHGYTGLAVPNAQVGDQSGPSRRRAIPFHIEKHRAGGHILSSYWASRSWRV